MGLTKDYLRYVPAGNFNIIASQNCNAVFVTLEGQIGRFVAVGACEHIIIWDLRLGEKAQVLPGEKAVVTRICASPNNRHLAAGYSDGSVVVYDLKTTEVVSIFSGHRNEITVLAYDGFGHKLASGSKDTDIIIWDTVAETGLCRFSGHKGPITGLAFMGQQNVLLSSAKDSFVKFWDLDTQHCFKTVTGYQTEVWGFSLLQNDKYLVTGCGDAELRVYKLSLRDPDAENKNPVEHLATTLELATLEDGDDATHPLQCFKVGSLLRSGKGRVVTLVSDSSGQVVACHGTDTQLELFYFCSEDEAQTRLKKRLKKERKKEKKEENMDIDQEPKPEPTSQQIGLKDEVKRLNPVKVNSKPKSLDLVLGNGGELRIAVNSADNCVKLFASQTVVKDAESKCLRSILTQGHHTEVKSVAFSHDNSAIASGSADTIKLWNRPSQSCLRTVENTHDVICLAFVHSDRHILAGLKGGKLLIIDIEVADILEEIPAHTGDLKSICLLPNRSGCVTGGSDQTVKFWQYELINDAKSEHNIKVLSLVHNRTLKLEDKVMCVKVSPNSKFIAVALLDSTVKIFFMDTFKFYLSLYGHKLPVQCMDISSDSSLIATGSGDRNVKIWGMDYGDCHKSIFAHDDTYEFYLSLYGHKLPVQCMDVSSDSSLIATGSGDRNVKIWGMDYGDCHKSIFAHDDTVTGLQFVPYTHYFFTCGKDGKVKQWDADKYLKIVSLQGHAGEAYSLSVSADGNHVVSCGSDRVLRLFEKSEQIVVLEDEEEQEREEQEGLATGEQTVVPGQPGLNLPSKKTIGSEKAAESILECLEVCEKYKEQLAEHEALQAASSQTLPLPQPPLLMQAYNASTVDDFLLETLRRIRASDMEEALLVLPFPSVCDVLQMLPNLIARGDCTELMCKVALFLLKLHHAPVVANQLLLATLEKLRKLIGEKVGELRDLVGYNYYGLQFIQRQIEAAEGVQLFRDATVERKKGEKKRKKREKIKRSIMVLNT